MKCVGLAFDLIQKGLMAGNAHTFIVGKCKSVYVAYCTPQTLYKEVGHSVKKDLGAYKLTNTRAQAVPH